MTYNDSRKKATLKYAKKHIKRIPLDVPLKKYDEIKEHSEQTKETVNGFIKRAIDETIQRDNEK